jgi:acetyltransferase-like isoleucine patch superfamily enzyme
VNGSSAVIIDPTAQIAPSAVIGTPFRPLLDGRRLKVDADTIIEADVHIGHFTTVGQGARIGAGSILDDHVSIQPRSILGLRVLVGSHASVGLDVTVGNDSVIKGHIGDTTRVGANCQISGDLIHKQLDPSLDYDDPIAEEAGPTVADGVFIGWRAMVIGGVNIGAGAYVCAGALVTRDVLAGHIAYGRNKISHPADWRGTLGKSQFFQGVPQVGGANVPLTAPSSVSQT